MTYIPGTSVVPYRAEIGTGSAGPYTVTHNLGTRDFCAMVRRNAGHANNISLTSPGEIIDVKIVPTGLNTCTVEPDETWATGQMHLVIWPVVGEDTSSPTGGVVNEVSVTSSQINVSITGATDPIGITFYEWDLNGTFVARTAVGVNTYSYTGLAGSTAYTIGCTAIDLQGNRTRFTRTSTTAASANVLFDAASTPTSATGTQANWSGTNAHTVGSGTNRILLVHVTTAHTGGGIDGSGTTLSGFATKTVTSNNGGALTLLYGVNNDNGSIGSTFVYYMLNPPTGAHTITCTFNTTGTWYTGFRMVATSYSNVASIALRTTRSGAAASALSIAATSAVGNIVGITLGLDVAAPVAFNQTQRVNTTGPGGSSDYMFVGDAAGAASVTFSQTGNQYQGAITYDLVKS